MNYERIIRDMICLAPFFLFSVDKTVTDDDWKNNFKKIVKIVLYI